MAKKIKGEQFETPTGRGVMDLSVDPTAGGGVAAPIGTIGLRDNAGTGEEWLKTGAANTAWTLQGSGIGAHALGGAEHTADSLANLNTKLTDAVLDGEDDPRPADEIIETGGPTTLAVGAVSDGQYLKRSGAAVVGDTPSSTDANAIHKNVAAEISTVTEKGTPVSADLLLIEDSADSNNKKRLQVGNLPSTDANAIHDNVAAEISAVTEKTTPVSADLILIEDSEASNAKKRVQVGNLPGGGAAGATVAAGGDYIWVRLTSDMTSPVSGEPIEYNSVDYQRGGLELDTVNYKITGLKAGRTYLLMSSTRVQYDAADIRWFDVDADSAIGQGSTPMPVNQSYDTSGPPVASVVFTPTVDTDVESRMVTIYGSCDIKAHQSWAMVVEIGAVQANVIGGLEFMDIIEVDSDVTSVSFGASGDGAFQRALDGDVDGTYILEYYFPDPGATTDVVLEPNGVGTDQAVGNLYGGSAAAGVGSYSDLRFFQVLSGRIGAGSLELQAKSGCRRTFRSSAVRGAIPESSSDVFVDEWAGIWDDTTTNITSLDIVASVASTIKTGARFTLWRRTTNNARADNASIYERNVEATVAQGTNSEVEYTTGHATYQGSAIGLSVSLNDTVSSGSITVNLKVDGSTVLTVSLTSGSFGRSVAVLGAKPVAPGDEIEVGIATTSLVTSGGGTPGITVNSMLVTDAFFQPSVSRQLESNLWYPPENPHADDDEFGATELNSAWTVTPSVSSSAIDPYASFASGGPRIELHTTRRPSWLMVQPDQQLARFDKPYTIPTNVLVWARLSFNLPLGEPTNNCSNIAIGFSDGLGASEADSIKVFLNEADATVTQAAFIKTESSSSSTINTSDNVSREGQAFAYVALHKVGTTFYAWVGTENGHWLYLGSTTHANLGNLDNLHIAANNASGTPGNPIVGIDFIRVVESATFLP